MIKLICYPKCSTCKKAQNYLDEKKIKYEYIDINQSTPNKKELKLYIEKSNKDIKCFFNTSGILYRKLELKDKLVSMGYEEKIDLLCSNGMLIKRPILVIDKVVLIGFKEKEWEEAINGKKS